MVPRLIPLSELDATALKQLADLHSSSMQTLLSELGQPLVLRYYQAAQHEPGTLGLCLLDSEGHLLGWAVGSPHPDRLNARLYSDPAWFLGQMLQVLVRHPAALIDLLRSLFSKSQANRLTADQIELTYIGVSPEVRGHGLGRQLLEGFCQAAIQQGCTSIALSVEDGNSSALALYTHFGFRVTKTFHEGRFERHRLVYTQ